MDDGVRALSECFAQTLSTDRGVRQQAEQQLKKLSLQPGFGLTLLKLVSLDTLPLEIRQGAAVTVKNYVKYRWVPRDADSLTGATEEPIADAEKDQIKAFITGLMLSAPPIVRVQVSEALAIISQHDFPARWPTLLPELVEKLNSGNPTTINGVLLTANSIFERYRGQYMTAEMNKELEYCQNVVKPLLEVFKGLRPALEASSGQPDTARLLLTSAKYAAQIFYSLNSPGLTELFEETLDVWMDEFHYYLRYDNPALAEADPEKESVVDGVKAAVCDNICLFMERNEEEFEKYLNTFASDVWQLLVGVKPNTGQDALAMTAIRFMTTVSRSVHAALFGSPEVLQQVCENIVLPNLRLRDEDVELFEVNYVEYIRRDTEGSDLDTRRRAACELVKALTEKFPAEVTKLFSGYVTAMLAQYAAAPGAAWQSKDAALYLVTALTVRGKTAAAGATSTNQLVNVLDFFNAHVVPDLQAGDINALPVLKADALKFLTTFRSQIPKQQCVALFPSLVSLLRADANVVHSYAAIAVERLLAMKEGGLPRFAPADVAGSLQGLLEGLFGAFGKPDSGENEYVMRAVMRVISFVGPQIAPVAPAALQQLSSMLLAVCKNPTQPGFNHYLFESIAALVKHSASAGGMTAQLEEMLFPPFELVLREDVQEFHPYVFQVFAQLIELRPAPMPPVYLGLLPGLLAPAFWERPGNVPALVRLLRAYLSKATDAVVSGGQLLAVLGVFQKLIASKALDHEGFAILTALLQHLALGQLEQYLPTVWQLLLQRLQSARTTKFVRHFVVFMALFGAKHGVARLQAALDAIQPGLFLMLLQNVWLSALPSIGGESERKVAGVGTTLVLVDCPDLQRPSADEFWGKLMGALMQLLEGGPQVGGGGGGEEEPDMEEYTGYSAAFAALHNAAAPEPELLPDVPDPRAFLASQLARFSAAQPGRVRRLVAAHVEAEMQAKLETYCQTAGVSIA